MTSHASRATAPRRLTSLKRLQLAVAIATTVAIATGLIWPGIMGLLLAPAGLLYVTWAIRAARDRRWSIWLSLACTLAVAVFGGTLSVFVSTSAFGNHDRAQRMAPLVAVDAAGAVIESPGVAQRQLEPVQARIDRQARVHASILLAISLGAWLVLGLHLLEWRWAFLGTGRPPVR